MAQALQNAGMLLAATTLFFRAHTRVLTTLTVAVAAAFFCLSSPAPTCATPTVAQMTEKSAPKSSLPMDPDATSLPRAALRLFFLLPHLLPHDN